MIPTSRVRRARSVQVPVPTTLVGSGVGSVLVCALSVWSGPGSGECCGPPPIPVSSLPMAATGDPCVHRGPILTVDRGGRLTLDHVPVDPGELPERLDAIRQAELRVEDRTPFVLWVWGAADADSGVIRDRVRDARNAGWEVELVVGAG